MKRPIVLIIPLVILVGIAGVYFLNQTQNQNTPQTENSTTQVQQKESAATLPGYQGKVLAGSSSPYLEFNNADYQKALSENKIIFLDFYANWCPICRAEAPNIQAGFNELVSDQVIGFRVNFNDSDTDENERRLASEFEIPYQHTKVILKNGKEVKRSGDAWDKETLISEIKSQL